MNHIILELQEEVGRLETILDHNSVQYKKNEMMSTREHFNPSPEKLLSPAAEEEKDDL